MRRYQCRGTFLIVPEELQLFQNVLVPFQRPQRDPVSPKGIRTLPSPLFFFFFLNVCAMTTQRNGMIRLHIMLSRRGGKPLKCLRSPGHWLLALHPSKGIPS